jgi:hypothetical protein
VNANEANGVVIGGTSYYVKQGFKSLTLLTADDPSKVNLHCIIIGDKMFKDFRIQVNYKASDDLFYLNPEIEKCATSYLLASFEELLF